MTDTRGQNDADALRTLIDRLASNWRTSIPARVDAFDAAQQSITATPTIRRVVTRGGQVEMINQAQITNVPLTYPYAQTAGFALTLPIQAGDEVMLVVADRSIDDWADFGGIQNPVEPITPRHHNISDSLAVIGATPTTRALENYQTSTMELRNRDRTVHVNVSNTAVTVTANNAILTVNTDGTITATAPGNATITAPTTTIDGNLVVTGNASVTGNADVTGTLEALSFSGNNLGAGSFTNGLSITGGTVTHNGTNIGDTHVHSGVLVGGANTQGPQ